MILLPATSRWFSEDGSSKPLRNAGNYVHNNLHGVTIHDETLQFLCYSRNHSSLTNDIYNTKSFFPHSPPPPGSSVDWRKFTFACLQFLIAMCIVMVNILSSSVGQLNETKRCAT
jgi:hypothetical protein